MVTASLTRVLMMAALWWLLAGGEMASWLFGGPVIALLAVWRLPAAGAVSSGRFRPWRIARFMPFFLWHSLTGSCDVAWRALHWGLPIQPALANYKFRLPRDSSARVVFANCVNLLPGTLVASWTGDELLIHVLTGQRRSLVTLQQLEDQVAWLFGHTLAPAEGAV